MAANGEVGAGQLNHRLVRGFPVERAQQGGVVLGFEDDHRRPRQKAVRCWYNKTVVFRMNNTASSAKAKTKAFREPHLTPLLRLARSGGTYASRRAPNIRSKTSRADSISDTVGS